MSVWLCGFVGARARAQDKWGYPDLPQSANTTACDQRGWMALELAWASLFKPLTRTLDLSQLDLAPLASRDGSTTAADGTAVVGGARRLRAALERQQVVRVCTQGAVRPALLLPAQFNQAVDGMAFGSKDDLKVVMSLYAASFEPLLSGLRRFDLASSSWGDAEVLQLVEVARSGALRQVQWLRLEGNKAIGGKGMHALAAAVGEAGCLSACEAIAIDDNAAGDAAAVHAALGRKLGRMSPSRAVGATPNLGSACSSAPARSGSSSLPTSPQAEQAEPRPFFEKADPVSPSAVMDIGANSSAAAVVETQATHFASADVDSGFPRDSMLTQTLASPSRHLSIRAPIPRQPFERRAPLQPGIRMTP